MVAPKRIYFWLSFASLHTRKALGACNIAIDGPLDLDDPEAVMKAVNKECAAHDLLPEECHQIRPYTTSEPDPEMELNRFYTSEEMEKMGY